MTRKNDQFEAGQEMARKVADVLNSFSDEPTRGFVEQMGREHRTLQQTFTGLCIAWLKDCKAKFEEGRYDGRNEASCDLAAKLLGNLEDRDLYLPCI